MILVMAGTSDGKALAIALQQQGYSVLVTVTSPYGEALASEAGLSVRVGPLDRDGLASLLHSEGVRVLIDATHPYAAQASHNAMAAAEAAGIPYLRYERPRSCLSQGGITTFDSVEALCRAVEAEPGNVLLTLGSNLLEPFGRLKNSDRLYARLLPVPQLLEKCLGYGFRPDRLLAMQGPFSEAFNVALIRQWGISVLVTKDSAAPGGFSEKVAAAEKTGIRLFVLERPGIAYPVAYSSEEAILAALSILPE